MGWCTVGVRWQYLRYLSMTSTQNARKRPRKAREQNQGKLKWILEKTWFSHFRQKVQSNVSVSPSLSNSCRVSMKKNNTVKHIIKAHLFHYLISFYCKLHLIPFTIIKSNFIGWPLGDLMMSFSFITTIHSNQQVQHFIPGKASETNP